jgi:hypothetical protein
MATVVGKLDPQEITDKETAEREAREASKRSWLDEILKCLAHERYTGSLTLEFYKGTLSRDMQASPRQRLSLVGPTGRPDEALTRALRALDHVVVGTPQADGEDDG